MILKLDFYHDASHGWLKVPLNLLNALDFKPTQFSFHDDKDAYLEEDCDASAFSMLIHRMGWTEERGGTFYHERWASIRAMRRFEGTSPSYVQVFEASKHESPSL